MPLKTGIDYIESLNKRRIKVYLFGEEVKNPTEHPIIKPSVNAAAVTYDIAFDPQYQELSTAKSHITGEKVNRFNHIHQNTEDL
ncbi:MAG: 4-hydroxyphenylacetate 3-hydroxylase N-terminal domain-containing protein, partial [Candidatus Bathyarchaeia archaeon]